MHFAIFALHFTRHYKQQVGFICWQFNVWKGSMTQSLHWFLSNINFKVWWTFLKNNWELMTPIPRHTCASATIDDIDNESKKGTDVGYSHWRCHVESRPVNPGPGKMTLRITWSLSLALFRTERAKRGDSLLWGQIQALISILLQF